jgi:orotidine-5'-phosphate decarboxylase
MQNISDKLIVALDVGTLEDARLFVDALYPTVKLFKIGSQLFTAYGPESVKMVGAKGGRVFLDLKFHDIPNTVKNSVLTGTSLSCVLSTTYPDLQKNIREAVQYPVFMMTVHTDGGIEMMHYASEGAKQRAKELNIVPPFVVGVTVLTSSQKAENTTDAVLKKAALAYQAGLNGVVCSVHEAKAVRTARGKDFIIVTPGIRPKGADADDQKRTATASEAVAAGADFIVVGRPIIEAKDPLRAAEEILRQIPGG